MSDQSSSLIRTILGLPIFRTEWVLYLLFALSVISIGVMFERWLFYQRRGVDMDAIRESLARHLDQGDFQAAAALLEKTDSLETNVVLVGLKAYRKGPESVEDLLAGALARERALREPPRVPRHPREQRALHRALRHRARDHPVVP